MSQQRTTDAKIKAQGGIHSTVATDVIGSGQGAITQKSNADEFTKKFGEAGKQIGDELAKGLKEGSKDLMDALNKFKGTTDSLANKGFQDQVGAGISHRNNQKEYGENYSQDLSQSGGQSQAAQGMGALRAFGAKKDDAVSTQKAIESLAGQSFTVSHGGTLGQAAEISQAKKSAFGSFAKYKTTQARSSVDAAGADYAGSTKEGEKTVVKTDDMGEELSRTTTKIEAAKKKDGSFNEDYKASMVTQAHEKAMFAVTSFNAGVGVGLYNSASAGGGLSSSGMDMIDGQVKDDIGKKVRQSESKTRQESFLDDVIDSGRLGTKEQSIAQLKNQKALDKDGKVGLNELIAFDSSSETTLEKKSFVAKGKDGRNVAFTGTTEMTYDKEGNRIATSNVTDIKSGQHDESGDKKTVNTSREQQMDTYAKSQAVKDFVKRTGNDKAQLRKGEDGKYLPMSEQSEEAQQLFEEFSHDTSYNKETFSNALAEAATISGAITTLAVVGYGANKMLGNPVGKGIDLLRGKTKPVSETKSKTDDNSKGYENGDDFENKHVNSLKDIDNINEETAKNQEDITKNATKIKDLEKTHSNLGSSIAKKRSQITSMEKSGASSKDISKAEDELSSMIEKQQGVGSSLSEAKEAQSSLVNRAEQLEDSLDAAKKEYLATETPKVKPTVTERVVDATKKVGEIGGAHKGTLLKGSSYLGLAAGVFHALQTEGAQGALNVIKNEVDESVNQFKQESKSIGTFDAGMNQVVDMLSGEKNRITARKQMANGETLNMLGTIGGGFVDGMVNGTQFMANVVTAAVKTGDQNLGKGTNLTYEQNFKAASSGQQFNSDIAGFFSNGGVASIQNSVSDFGNNVSSSFGNFMNNMGLGNSSVSSVTASALSQPSNLGGVNMMNSSVLPPMAQQDNNPAKGGILDPTSTLNGMINLANTGNQQLANQQIQGEVNQVGNQIDVVKNFLDKMVKNPQDNEFLKIKSSLNKTN